MKALVVYQSKTGTTKKMAEEIAVQLKELNNDVKLGSIAEVTVKDVELADKLYIGGPTNGFFLFGQGPTKDWKDFVKSLPIVNKKETILFTTYKIATGPVFKKMRRELNYSGFKVMNKALKSKDGNLSDIHREILSQSLN